ncbi:Fe-S cluster assembly protein SufD [Anaerolineales bacterium HSG6]|nr:Fe-S cluster assembly protein SufD [Anaerolineales bacterium HSG6]MDM8532507.1 Fe-S cluster assembly protein SufD [Anaerolineales bacterium HSG25]
MSTTLTTPKDALLDSGFFSRADVEAISDQLNEPDWLREFRQLSWTVFEDIPMPTSSDEAWRRTNLRKIRWPKFNITHTSTLSPVTDPTTLPDDVQNALDLDRPAAGRMVIVNNQVIYHELDSSVAEKGIIFTDLSTAAREHTELVQKSLGKEAVPPSNSKFSALNSALWQCGIFLYIPKGIELEDPFQVALVLEGEGSVIMPRTLIVAEQSASVNYIEESLSHGSHGQALNVGVVELYPAEDAQIRYVDVQQWGDDVYNFNVKRSVGPNDSVVIWETGQLGGRLTKSYYDSLMPGNGANVEFNGVFFLQGKQHLDIDCLLRHTGLATNADLLLHGALKDKSRSVFTGLIKIDETGQQTNSYLKNENLMLDETARADSIPSLEIDANDVRASHGATIGKIVEEYVFYLMSRGIPRKTAVRMVVEGFFYKVFDRMHYNRVRDKLFNAVSKKIGN